MSSWCLRCSSGVESAVGNTTLVEYPLVGGEGGKRSSATNEWLLVTRGYWP